MFISAWLTVDLYTGVVFIAGLGMLAAAFGFGPHIVGVLVRLLGFVLRVSDRPNVTFGTVQPDFANGTRPYETWFHLSCVNQPNVGWRRHVARTRDAQDSWVLVALEPNSGEGAGLSDDGIFTQGATSELRTTLLVGKPVAIPVYWVAPHDDTRTPHGWLAPAGYYLTGNEWVQFPERLLRWRVAPGPYRLTVTVTWSGHAYHFYQDLAVPDIKGEENAALVPGGSPSVRVTPMNNEFRYRCLLVENVGTSAEFRAQIDFEEGKDAWVGIDNVGAPATPYNGYWDGYSSDIIKLLSGQRARLLIMGLLPQGGQSDPYYLPQFAHFNDSNRHMFYGARIERGHAASTPPLVIKVVISSIPSMAEPFVGRFRYRDGGPLEQID